MNLPDDVPRCPGVGSDAEAMTTPDRLRSIPWMMCPPIAHPWPRWMRTTPGIRGLLAYLESPDGSGSGKDTLPMWAPVVAEPGSRCRSSTVRAYSMLVVDIDGGPMDDCIQWIRALPCSWIAHATPSAARNAESGIDWWAPLCRARVILPLAEDVPAETWSSTATETLHRLSPPRGVDLVASTAQARRWIIAPYIRGQAWTCSSWLTGPLLQPVTPAVRPPDVDRRSRDEARERDRLLDMLEAIPADVSYPEWIQVGMALHAEGYPLATWDTWSQRGDKYRPGECARMWQGFERRLGGAR